MTKKLKPGQNAPASGQYEEVGPRGGRTGHEVTSTKGEPLPPTRGKGRGYVLADPSLNQEGNTRYTSIRNRSVIALTIHSQATKKH